MAPIAPAAARGYPHPIPERGKRRRRAFFGAAGRGDPRARLVKVQRGNRAADRQYDGQNRRITKTVGETATHFFFNESWQVLETRVGAGPDPLDKYLWDIRYIDAAVVRFHDADTNGSYEDAGVIWGHNTDSPLTGRRREGRGHEKIGIVSPELQSFYLRVEGEGGN